MNNNDQIKELYQKYLAKDISSSEYDELFDLLKEESNVIILKEEMGEEWAEIDPITSPVLWQDLQSELSRQRKSPGNRLKIVWWMAAASIILLTTVYLWPSDPVQQFTVYTTGYGQVEKITLDDGSQIIINANSEVKWQKDWKSLGVREVYVKGEAFFEVNGLIEKRTKEKLPFRVFTDDLTINVVGTVFNVKNRGSQTEVFLDEGKVLLELNERQKEEIEMFPGEEVSYSKESKNLKKSNASVGIASWRIGTLEYVGVKVSSILSEMSDVYGIKFNINDRELLDRTITAGLPYTDWSIVKQSLGLILGVEFEEREGVLSVVK